MHRGSGSRTQGGRAWQHLGGRKGRRGDRDPAASRHSEQPALAGPGLHGERPPPPPPRPARRSPPPLQGAPRSSGLPGAVAALSGRARLGSSPRRSLAPFRPPPAGTERRAEAAESRPQADCPLPPRQGHLPLMPAGRPRPGPAPSGPGSVGGPPGRARPASPPTAPRARPRPRRPPAPPGAGRPGALANRGQGDVGGGANANRAALRSLAGKPGQKSLGRSLPAPRVWRFTLRPSCWLMSLYLRGS